MLNNERMLLKWIIKKNQTFITNSQRNNIHMDSCTHRQIQHTTITYFKHRRLFLTPADGGRTCRSLQSFAALSYNFAALSYNIVEVKPYVTRAIKMKRKPLRYNCDNVIFILYSFTTHERILMTMSKLHLNICILLTVFIQF